MLLSRKVQRDSPRANDRYHSAGEGPCALVARLARQAQNPHARVVVCASRCLAPPAGSTPPAPGGLVSQASMSSPCVVAGNGIPSCCSSLSSRLKGTPVSYFNSAIIATAVSSYLSGPAVSGSSAVKTSPQGVEAQSLHLKHGGFQRRLPHESHQRRWFLLAVDFSLAAFRAKVAGVECGVPKSKLGLRR